ncbi:MAG TPA: hypothetical protein VGQ37_11835 [Vicinamibacterales bacterium]|jgi:hypothetical protein|nr:hypothetical protein [Vicinamibacterales bacterium]
MYARVLGAALLLCAGAARAMAQEPADPHAGHQTPQAGHTEHEGHDMSSMARDGSGTSWQPDTTPMYAFHTTRGGWQLMAHENLFVQYLHESGERGADQGGSINWFMGMAQRPVGRGRVQVNGMLSLEPFTIPGCGYPDLLASGEQCDGEANHDRQHPHDLFMELSARYDAPVAHGLRWQLYGGPAAEPALGPVAFPHRLSAMPNPLAPIAHHWLDATHVAFGVVTGGVYGARWKAEASVFNGREPDDQRTGFDFGALDSVSARLSYLPARAVALQVSAGRLEEAEAGDAGGPRVDVTRITASATVHATLDSGVWATTLAWGRNAEADHSSHAFLAETSVTLRDRDTWFGRFESAGKTGHDLDLSPEDDRFRVAKLQGGYTRYLPPRRGFAPGLGAALSAGFVPANLRAIYGSRVNLGGAIFVTVRPARAM